MSLRFSFSLSRKQFDLNVELATAPGEITAIMGHSGAGKTTLLRCMAGLEKSAQGYCYFRGQCWQDSSRHYFLPTHRRCLAYVSQEIHLFPHLSVNDNLEFGYKRIARSKRIAQLNQVISWFDINHLLNHDIKNLSGGERQRIAIAQAILKSPELLLMDEPFTAMDSTIREVIINGILTYQRLTNAAIMYVTHTEENIFIKHTQLKLEAGKIIISS